MYICLRLPHHASMCSRPFRYLATERCPCLTAFKVWDIMFPSTTACPCFKHHPSPLMGTTQLLTSCSTSKPPFSFDQNSCPPNWELLLEASDTASAAWSWARRGSARGLELVGVPAQDISLLSDLACSHDIWVLQGCPRSRTGGALTVSPSWHLLHVGPQVAWVPALDGCLMSALTGGRTVGLSLGLIIPTQPWLAARLCSHR